mgnify:CR=1 FL=1
MLYARFKGQKEKRLIGWFKTYSKLDYLIFKRIDKQEEAEGIFESNLAWARFGRENIF